MYFDLSIDLLLIYFGLIAPNNNGDINDFKVHFVDVKRLFLKH